MSQVKAPTTRERLVSSAAAVIADGGYTAASVAAIAHRAGLAAGALYYHFPSKADLFVEVFRAAAQDQLAAMQAAAARAGTLAERLESVITTYATSALSNRRLAWALVYEPVDPLVDAERLAYRRRYCDGMAELLRQGINAGSIPAQDVQLSAAAVVGAIAEALVGPLSPVAAQTLPDEQIVRGIVDFCQRAVGIEERSQTQ
jgi:AcrR family transcriptional regulator